MPAFSHFQIVGGDSISLELSARLIGLPMWRDLSLNTVEKIAEIINSSIK
jgi:dTDP-4-amino-4,6-dideoxygalactose transaminase